MSELQIPTIRAKPGATTLRVLVTGSRSWPDLRSAVAARKNLIWALDSALDWVRCSSGTVRTLTVVHGAARDGADDVAHAWCILHADQDVIEEAYPAKDFPHPLRRDDAMVDLGADLCLATIALCVRPECRSKDPHGTHGASYTASRALLAGIPIGDVSP